MIFISGVHGVGKSFFCEEVKSRLGLNSYSASRLISDLKKEGFAKDKLIPDIDENQGYLLAAIDKLDVSENQYLLDGHFCLLNAQGEVQRIELQTFFDLKPNGIVLLTEEPAVIAERRRNRDGIYHEYEQIDAFQTEEVLYASEVSEVMCIPLFVSKGAGDIQNAIEFINSLIHSIHAEN